MQINCHKFYNFKLIALKVLLKLMNLELIDKVNTKINKDNINIVIVGPENTGKTCFFHRYANDIFLNFTPDRKLVD